MDQLVRLTHCVHLTNEDWTRVLKVLPNKLLKNHPFRPRTPLYTLLGQLDLEGNSMCKISLSELRGRLNPQNIWVCDMKITSG